MALVLKPDSGFLNCQARYILGADFASISDSEITRRLNSYCYIATEQTPPDLYQAFGFAEIPRDANEFRENAASKYHFDITIFNTPGSRISRLSPSLRYRPFGFGSANVLVCARAPSLQAGL